MILRFERAAVAWTRRLAMLAGFMLLAVALGTVADALLRYFLNRPVPGTFEATELLLAAIIFFGLPYTCLTDSHVAVDMMVQRLSRRAQHAIVAVNALVAAALVALITWQMAGLAAEYLATHRTTITARIPIFPFILPVTVAGALATLGFLAQAVGAATRAVNPGLPPLPTAHAAAE